MLVLLFYALSASYGVKFISDMPRLARRDIFALQK